MAPSPLSLIETVQRLEPPFQNPKGDNSYYYRHLIISVRNISTPSRGDKGQMNTKNITFPQSKTVYQKDVDKYTSILTEVKDNYTT